MPAIVGVTGRRAWRSGQGADEDMLRHLVRHDEGPLMSETNDRLIASGNVTEVFDRGSRVLKLYKRPEAKQGWISRAFVIGWFPYVAAARLAEEVPGELDRLLPIASKI